MYANLFIVAFSLLSHSLLLFSQPSNLHHDERLHDFICFRSPCGRRKEARPERRRRSSEVQRLLRESRGFTSEEGFRGLHRQNLNSNRFEPSLLLENSIHSSTSYHWRSGNHWKEDEGEEADSRWNCSALGSRISRFSHQISHCFAWR